MPALPFLAEGFREGRRIHHSTVNPTPDPTVTDAQYNPQIVDLGEGNLVAVYDDENDLVDDEDTGPYIRFSWSDNNGVSWVDGGRLAQGPDGEFGRPALAKHAASDTVYLAQSTFNFSQIMVFKSTDLGHTFDGDVANASPGAPPVASLPDIAVDNFGGATDGNVYVCWLSEIADVLFSRSTNDGTSFGPNGGRLISEDFSFCTVAAGANKRVYVFFSNGAGDLFVRRSTNAGQTFGAPVLITQTDTAGLPLLQVAVNPVDARPFLYAAFADDPAGADEGDVFVVRSTNQGQTWNARVQINDDAAGIQSDPDLAFVDDGEAMLFTYSSLDPETGLQHRRGRIATLNGAGNVVLNPQSFRLSPDAPIGATSVFGGYSGEYQGSDGGDGVVSTLWSDARLGNSFHQNQQDIRFARIAVPSPNTNIATTLSSSPANIALGEDSVVTVEVTASGTTASDVFLNVSTPTGLAIRAVTGSGGQCHKGATSSGCYLGNIAAGGKKTVQLVVTAIHGPGTRTLSAVATTSSRDSTPGNNSASQNIIVANAGTLVTVNNESIPFAIPDDDEEGVAVGIPVQIEGTVVQATVGVRINHTFDEDLEMYLVSPLHQLVPLALARGGNGDNFGSPLGNNTCGATKTVFNDLAANHISAGVAPFAGFFRPEQPIASALGGPSDGTWILFVADLADQDVGTLGCFELKLRIVE